MPDAIPRTAVRDILRALGVDTSRSYRTRCDFGLSFVEIIVDQYLVDENGEKVISGNELMSETVQFTIPYSGD